MRQQVRQVARNGGGIIGILSVVALIAALAGGLLAARTPRLGDRVPVAERTTAVVGPKLAICGIRYVQPATFQFPCSGSRQLWLDLRWQSWTSTKAFGLGQFWDPSGAGQFDAFPMRVQLSAPTGHGVDATFTRLTMTFPGEAPDSSVGTTRRYQIQDGELVRLDPKE